MFLITTLSKNKLLLKNNSKIIPGSVVSEALEVKELQDRIHAECETYKEGVVAHCEDLKKEAFDEGFREGQQAWANQIAYLESTLKQTKEDLKKGVAPLIMTAIKKIIGHELTVNPSIIVDVIQTALKNVFHQRSITIYVSRADYPYAEQQREALKQRFDQLDSFHIVVKEDLPNGESLIETESGIIKTGITDQLQSLEKAFQQYLDHAQ